MILKNNIPYKMLFSIRVSADKKSACFDNSIKSLSPDEIHSIVSEIFSFDPESDKEYTRHGCWYIMYNDCGDVVGCAQIHDIAILNSPILVNFGILSKYRQEGYGTILFHFIALRYKHLLFESEFNDNISQLFYTSVNAQCVNRSEEDNNILWSYKR